MIQQKLSIGQFLATNSSQLKTKTNEIQVGSSDNQGKISLDQMTAAERNLLTMKESGTSSKALSEMFSKMVGNYQNLQAGTASTSSEISQKNQLGTILNREPVVAEKPKFTQETETVKPKLKDKTADDRTSLKDDKAANRTDQNDKADAADANQDRKDMKEANADDKASAQANNNNNNDDAKVQEQPNTKKSDQDTDDNTIAVMANQQVNLIQDEEKPLIGDSLLAKPVVTNDIALDQEATAKVEIKDQVNPNAVKVESQFAKKEVVADDLNKSEEVAVTADGDIAVTTAQTDIKLNAIAESVAANDGSDAMRENAKLEAKQAKLDDQQSNQNKGIEKGTEPAIDQEFAVDQDLLANIQSNNNKLVQDQAKTTNPVDDVLTQDRVETVLKLDPNASLKEKNTKSEGEEVQLIKTSEVSEATDANEIVADIDPNANKPKHEPIKEAIIKGESKAANLQVNNEPLVTQATQDALNNVTALKQNSDMMQSSIAKAQDDLSLSIDPASISNASDVNELALTSYIPVTAVKNKADGGANLQAKPEVAGAARNATADQAAKLNSKPQAADAPASPVKTNFGDLLAQSENRLSANQGTQFRGMNSNAFEGLSAISSQASSAVSSGAGGGFSGGELTTIASASQGSSSSSANAQHAASLSPNQRYSGPSQALGEQITAQMKRSLATGEDRVSVKLNPAELGRVEIKMDVNQEGKFKAAITVEKPETLELLKQDSRQLVQLLQDAGMNADSSNLSFNLQSQNDNASGKDQNAQRQGQTLNEELDNQDLGQDQWVDSRRYDIRTGGLDIRA